jgi:hypothetical protein
MLLLRVLARIAAIALMIILALAGLALALFCLDGFIRLGSARPDRLLHLAVVRDHVGRFLHQVSAPGPAAGLALLCGIGAVVLGIVLMVGVLAPRRQRLILLEREGPEGRLAARPAPLRDMASALAASAPGATAVARPRLRRGGRLRPSRLTLTATRSRTQDAQQVERAIGERLHPLTEPFGVHSRVHVRSGEPGSRVQ